MHSKRKITYFTLMNKAMKFRHRLTHRLIDLDVEANKIFRVASSIVFTDWKNSLCQRSNFVHHQTRRFNQINIALVFSDVHDSPSTSEQIILIITRDVQNILTGNLKLKYLSSWITGESQVFRKICDFPRHLFLF